MLRRLLLFCLLLSATNTSAQLLASIRSAYHVDGIGYRPDSKVDSFFYDENGRLTTIQFLNLIDDGLNEEEQSMQYDQQNRLKQVTWLRLLSGGGRDSISYTLYQYLPAGQISSISLFQKRMGHFRLIQEEFFIYSADGRLLSKGMLYPNMPNWSIGERTDYYYDAASRIDSVSYFNWRDGRLQYSGRNVYSYIDSLNEVHIRPETLNPYTYQFEIFGAFRHHYASASGPLDSSFYFYFWPQFVQRYKTVYRRLPNDSLAEVEEFIGAPWRPTVKRTYFYRDFQPLQKVVVSNRLHIFPNPAQQQLQVDQLGAAGGQLLIFDLRGQLKKSELLRSDRQVLFVGDLPAGIYILQLTTPEGQTSTARLVKQ